MSKQQEKIKTYLHQIGNEQYNSTFFTFKTHLSRSNQYNSAQFTELTDWTNQKVISSTDLPSLTDYHASNHHQHELHQTTYHSSLFKNNRKFIIQQSMNPINIKFDEREKKSSHKKPSLFINKVSKNKNQHPQKLRSLLDRTNHSQNGRYKEDISLPRTERCSSILRILKKRQKVKAIKRKMQNSEDFRAIKLQ